ncbi:hypothetical protein F4Y59_11955 [Candidatus Poribacteria bacterium]|nr:hypothetical protein [Candidatus Poribacteria bacterium]MXY28859.1 hypothetical protein [Candidatus Poribacteria bacterium]
MKSERGKAVNDNQLTTKDMFEILRSDISEVKAQISEVRSDIHALDDRLRRVEETVAGTKAVATYQRQLVDWLFRIAAVIGVGGALKAFLS